VCTHDRIEIIIWGRNSTKAKCLECGSELRLPKSLHGCNYEASLSYEGSAIWIRRPEKVTFS